MQIRDFKIFKHSELQSLHQEIDVRFNDWANSWLGNGCNTRLDVVQESNPQWQTDSMQVYHLENGIGSMYLIVSEEHIQHLGKQIFQKECGENLDLACGTIARGVVLKAFAGLGVYVLGQNETPELSVEILQSVPGHVYVPGSGCVCVTATVDGYQYSLLLSKDVVEMFLPKSDTPRSVATELEPAEQAIKHIIVNCKAKLGTAEVSFGELISLQVGDVVRLQQKLDQPIALVAGDGSEGCLGSLGSSDGKKAIKIVQRPG